MWQVCAGRLVAVADRQVFAALRRLDELEERAAGRRARRIEMRSPGVRGNAQGVCDADAASIGSPFQCLDDVAMRQAAVAEACVGVGDGGHGIRLGKTAHHADERRRDAVEFIGPGLGRQIEPHRADAP